MAQAAGEPERGSPDGDPGGVADVIGIHYPHEYPQYTCWPNDAYWLDQLVPASGFAGCS